MMRTILFTLALLICALPLFALPRIAYVGMSAALPGTAELALDKPIRGGVMLTADLISLITWMGYRNEVADYTDSYKRYAQQYAGVPITTGDLYYRHIQSYNSSDDFNANQEMMARNYYLLYNYDPDAFAQYLEANLYTEEEAWQWQSPDHQQEYRSLRRSRQKAAMYQNLALGALILNRAISVVDALFLSSSSGKKAIPVSFEVTPDNSVFVNYSLEF